MALKQKLSEEELALLEVIEDPVWFSEFMHDTRDGSPYPETYPEEEFKLRWYQRDLMTDRSAYVTLRGGRAIGKCQPASERVYTTEGYRTIRELKGEKFFAVWCLDDQGKFVQRRALCQKDKWTKVYKVVTESGNVIRCTANHPLLTPTGYEELQDLKEGDEIAVVRYLPTVQRYDILTWAELRYIGYIYLRTSWRAESPIKPRFKQIRGELQKIADDLNLKCCESFKTGEVTIERLTTNSRHPMKTLFLEAGLRSFYYNANIANFPRSVPWFIMESNPESIKIFLEAVLAQFAEFSATAITLQCTHFTEIHDLAELFYRCGVEVNIDEEALTISCIKPEEIRKLYATFSIPGIAAPNVSHTLEAVTTHRFEKIVSLTLDNTRELTYSLYVYGTHNYISENCIVHNSFVLEDKILYDIINQDYQYPKTKEMLIATANQAQLEPLQGRLLTRMTTSPLFKDYLENRINRSLGVLDFRFRDIQFLLRLRIAGSKVENSLVGLTL